MAVDTAALLTELNTDPKGLGLAAATDGAAAALLNVSAASNAITIATTDAATIMACVVLTDYVALSADQRAYFELVIAANTIRLLDPSTGAQTRTTTTLATLFPANTATGVTLRQILSRNASRAEFLFGAGTVVTQWDVAHARGHS